MVKSSAAKQSKIKRVVIREDYVAITGDWRAALILHQFVYWSDRCGDIDTFIEEENIRRLSTLEEQIPLTEGWIYKTAEQLSKEIMHSCSRATVRRVLDKLTRKGLIQQRNNPKYKFDQTLQYRVDFVLLQRMLKDAGYSMEGKMLTGIQHRIDTEAEIISISQNVQRIE